MPVLRFQPMPLELSVVPQAIFSRPIRWFCLNIRIEEDDLDSFEAIGYGLGNALSFEIRHYAGHAHGTSTLYLPFERARDEDDVSADIGSVIRNLLIPLNAVAWRRGERFQHGHLERKLTDRIREPEARILALKIAALQPNRTATTELIKNSIPNFVELSDEDKKPMVKRGGEPRWRQIVGNIVSHQDSPNGPFVKGLARRTRNGLTVTNAGMDYLNSIGFSV